jgi:hypothetical protein
MQRSRQLAARPADCTAIGHQISATRTSPRRAHWSAKAHGRTHLLVSQPCHQGGTAQICTLRSPLPAIAAPPAVSKCVPSGVNLAPMTHSGAGNRRVTDRSAGFQMTISPSLPADTSKEPSGDHATRYASFAPEGARASCLPLSTSHTTGPTPSKTPSAPCAGRRLASNQCPRSASNQLPDRLSL